MDHDRQNHRTSLVCLDIRFFYRYPNLDYNFLNIKSSCLATNVKTSHLSFQPFMHARMHASIHPVPVPSVGPSVGQSVPLVHPSIHPFHATIFVQSQQHRRSSPRVSQSIYWHITWRPVHWFHDSQKATSTGKSPQDVISTNQAPVDRACPRDHGLIKIYQWMVSIWTCLMPTGYRRRFSRDYPRSVSVCLANCVTEMLLGQSKYHMIAMVIILPAFIVCFLLL